MTKVNFRNSDFRLGDTHYSLQDIAEETGLAYSTVAQHARIGPLKGCPRVQIAGVSGAPIAIKSTPLLESYIERRAKKGRDYAESEDKLSEDKSSGEAAKDIIDN